MIARRIPKRWRYKIRRIYLQPGKLIVGIFLWDKHLFFMATSLCHSLVRHTIGGLLLKRRLFGSGS